MLELDAEEYMDDDAHPGATSAGNSPYAAWSEQKLDDMISQFSDLKRHPAHQEIDTALRAQRQNVLESMVRTADARELRIQQGYAQGLEAMIEARAMMHDSMVAEKRARDAYVAPQRPLDDRGI